MTRTTDTSALMPSMAPGKRGPRVITVTVDGYEPLTFDIDKQYILPIPPPGYRWSFDKRADIAGAYMAMVCFTAIESERWELPKWFPTMLRVSRDIEIIEAPVPVWVKSVLEVRTAKSDDLCTEKREQEAYRKLQVDSWTNNYSVFEKEVGALSVTPNNTQNQ